MCVTHVKTYVHPDGRRETFERKDLCQRSDGQSPCRLHIRRKYAEQPFPSGSAIASPSLVDDDVPTPSSGSFPSTPPSMTSGPRIETREPSSSAKGKAKGPRRTINFEDLSFSSPKARKDSGRRRDDPSPRAHFADEKVTLDTSDATIRPTSSTRRGRADTPSPSILRSQAPNGLNSPSNPRTRHTPTEVHQLSPPSPPRPVSSSHRRNLTEPTGISRSSSSYTDSTDADVYTRPDYRARARENHQRQERDRRREEAEDRRRQEQEARERAEDEHSLREYHRINAREDIRRAQRSRLPGAEELESLDKRVKALQNQARERQEQEQVERIANEIRERRERIRDTARREEEAEAQVQDGHRHDAERLRDLRFRDAVSQIPSRTDETGLTDDIRRVANSLELDRETRRQREREEERREELRAELRRIQALEQEIRHLETELRHRSEVQNHHPDQRPEQLHNDRPQHNDWQQHNDAPQRDAWPYYNTWPQHPGWQQYPGWQQRNSWNGSAYNNNNNNNFYNPSFEHRRVIGPAYPSPSTPTTPSAVQIRSPYDDENYRRARGERVLQQERAFANARDRAMEMQQAVNNNAAAIPGGGLFRRNTLNGGRESGRTYRHHYPWWGL